MKEGACSGNGDIEKNYSTPSGTFPYWG